MYISMVDSYYRWIYKTYILPNKSEWDKYCKTLNLIKYELIDPTTLKKDIFDSYPSPTIMFDFCYQVLKQRDAKSISKYQEMVLEPIHLNDNLVKYSEYLVNIVECSGDHMDKWDGEIYFEIPLKIDESVMHIVIAFWQSLEQYANLTKNTNASTNTNTNNTNINANTNTNTDNTYITNRQEVSDMVVNPIRAIRKGSSPFIDQWITILRTDFLIYFKNYLNYLRDNKTMDYNNIWYTDAGLEAYKSSDIKPNIEIIDDLRRNINFTYTQYGIMAIKNYFDSHSTIPNLDTNENTNTSENKNTNKNKNKIGIEYLLINMLSETSKFLLSDLLLEITNSATAQYLKLSRKLISQINNDNE